MLEIPFQYSQVIKFFVSVVKGVIIQSSFILPNCPERVSHVVSVPHFPANGVSSVLREAAGWAVVEEIPALSGSLDHHYTVRPAPIAAKSSFWWPQGCLSDVGVVIISGVPRGFLHYYYYNDQCKIPISINHNLQHVKWISRLWLVGAPGVHLRICLAPSGQFCTESHIGRLHENSNTQF